VFMYFTHASLQPATCNAWRMSAADGGR
jgi:hypothetical protein